MIEGNRLPAEGVAQLQEFSAAKFEVLKERYRANKSVSEGSI
jgi:hypothetical protein